MARIAVLLLVTLVACTPTSDPSTTAVTASSSTTATTERPTTTTTPGDFPICLEGDTPFVEDGSAGVLTQSPGDAVAIGTLTWRDFGPCERLVIDYRTAEGAPAVDPPTIATLLIRSSAVLRLSVDGAVTASGFYEQVVDSDLVSEVFAVETQAKTIFLDIHLADAALARVTNLSSPAQTVIDLRGGGIPLAARPIRAGDTIVVEPLGGDVTYPFSVSGYTLAQGSAISASLIGAEETTETSAAIADRFDTWGSFTLLFTDGPAGPISVAIGDIKVALTARR